LSLKDELGLALHVAHLDHGLRGKESFADAEYVADLAEKFQLPVTVGHADVRAFQASAGLTLEEAARDVRYSFLSEVCRSAGAEYILTGHTRDDNVETILLHIVRGSGTRGLVGLRPLTSRNIDGEDVTIARPLIDITREETVDYCRLFALEPRTDSSNLELSPLRNRIRLKLLPLLAGYNSNISDALLRMSAVAGSELDYLDSQVERLWGSAAVKRGDVITLGREVLSCVHPALKRHLLRACLEQLPEGLKDIESAHVESMLSLLGKPAGRRIDLPHGLVFMAGYDNYLLGRESGFPAPYPRLSGIHILKVPGATDLPGWRVDTEFVRAIDTSVDNPLTVFIDGGSAGKLLSVRTWKNGDRFQPVGLGAEKKLGEFMIDAKIPGPWRRNIPLVVSPAGIVWLVGYRLDERYIVNPKTTRVLRVSFQPVAGL
jgi:tRNA(Ile)-lysidine synthase